MSNVRLGNDMERQMESSTTVAQSTPKGAWKITVLLLFYMVVNFADKIVVGLAGVPIMTELKLTPAQFGFLGSAFFFLFSIASILVGFLLNRFTARWVALSGLGARSVPDGMGDQLRNACRLPHHSRRG